MRAAWLTDIHLNFLAQDELAAFAKAVLQQRPDILLISGDIGEADSVVRYLGALMRRWGRPLYFVLGNHDFYRGAFWSVQADIAGLTARVPELVWLTQAGVIPLTEQTALIGHDSWADGRLGDYEASPVLLNDYFFITELAGLSKPARLAKLHALGDAAAEHFARVLPQALATHRDVIALTHVPPYAEVCRYGSEPTDANYLPHFACKVVGDVLCDIMACYPDHTLTVLCGHTHSPAQAQILENLTVLCGGAEYGSPQVQRVFEVS